MAISTAARIPVSIYNRLQQATKELAQEARMALLVAPLDYTWAEVVKLECDMIADYDSDQYDREIVLEALRKTAKEGLKGKGEISVRVQLISDHFIGPEFGFRCVLGLIVQRHAWENINEYARTALTNGQAFAKFGPGPNIGLIDPKDVYPIIARSTRS